MPKKRFSAEQIVTLLRQIEVSMAQGKSTRVVSEWLPGRASRTLFGKHPRQLMNMAQRRFNRRSRSIRQASVIISFIPSVAINIPYAMTFGRPPS